MRLLLNPIEFWTNLVAEVWGENRKTVRSCRLRQQADEEIYLDDQGLILESKIAYVVSAAEERDQVHRKEWIKDVSVS